MIPIISWKNIWRNKGRSLIVISAITLGLFGGLFCAAFFQGMAERRVDEALTKEISHIQIHQPEYLENPEIGFTINNPTNLLKNIEARSGVKAVTGRIKFSAMAASSSSNTGVSVIGINPDQEKKVTSLYQALYTEGQIRDHFGISDPDQIQKFLEDSVGYYFENVKSNPVFIGEELARKLKIKVRSKIVLTFQNANGQLTGSAFRVCGIFRTENSAFEEANVFVRQTDLQQITGLAKDAVHEIAILLNSDDLTRDLEEQLSSDYPNLEISDWKEIQPDIAMINDMMTVLMEIIMIIVLLALGFGIVNTMLMVVLERTKEIGMLMAVGMSKIRVFLMIILESVLLCLTGGTIGMIFSALIISTLNQHGLDLTALAQEGFEAMGFGAVFYPSLNAEFYVLVTIMVILTGVLSSVYPAWKALKLNPAEALRTE
jgi:putative ABC transport system permease protein